jgi:hypothetical protein
MKLIPEFSELLPMTRSADEDTAALMTRLFKMVGDAGRQVYLLIDEYDHFGNRLLSDGQTTTYQDIVKAAGVLRSFYASLKAFTRQSTLARTFITGVSPIMLDDLSSGFNIVTHISHRDVFSAMTGFTQADVERAIDTMLHDRPEFANDPRIGNHLEVWSWAKRGAAGKRKLWTLKRRVVTVADFDPDIAPF